MCKWDVDGVIITITNTSTAQTGQNDSLDTNLVHITTPRVFLEAINELVEQKKALR